MVSLAMSRLLYVVSKKGYLWLFRKQVICFNWLSNSHKQPLRYFDHKWTCGGLLGWPLHRCDFSWDQSSRRDLLQYRSHLMTQTHLTHRRSQLEPLHLATCTPGIWGRSQLLIQIHFLTQPHQTSMRLNQQLWHLWFEECCWVKPLKKSIRATQVDDLNSRNLLAFVRRLSALSGLWQI